MEDIKKGEIVIYKAPEGPGLQVRFVGESIWLNLTQIALLFGTQKPAISKHIHNIYKSAELSQKATVSKMETVQNEGGRAVKRTVEYYNLDMIISVGYRVSSQKATQFRIWATARLKEYLLKGYAVNKDRLQQLKAEHNAQMKELQDTVKLFQNVLESQRSFGYEKDLLQVITDYTNTWAILHLYDSDQLSLDQVKKKPGKMLDYIKVQESIASFKRRLMAKKEAGELFGREVGGKFQAVLGSIYQTYGGRDLYTSLEEKAAHLLYFCIKDHPFADGNKRIGSLVFLLFLIENNHLYNKKGERKLNDNALAALALLIAESKPQQKDIMVKLVVNLINKK